MTLEQACKNEGHEEDKAILEHMLKEFEMDKLLNNPSIFITKILKYTFDDDVMENAYYFGGGRFLYGVFESKLLLAAYRTKKLTMMLENMIKETVIEKEVELK